MSQQLSDRNAVMTQLEAVEGRNRGLRKQNRVLKVVSALGLAVIGALLLTAAATDQPVEVKAERFVLVDPQGRECAVMGVSADGAPALTLYDSKGKARVVMEVPADQPRLCFFDATGKVTLTVPEPRNRSWGPEQVAGEPNTESAGDHGTAWASKTPDGQDEWLVLDYAEAVTPVAVKVYETFHPGAVSKVSIFDAEGDEVEVWTGEDPTSADSDMGVSEVKVKTDVQTKRVKIYLKSSEVPGWNEIDAVGLVDTNGNTHWATAAAASSTFAE